MQQRNAQNVRLLSADLQPRYEPNFAWKSACSAYLALPALRGFWPMSSVDYAAANRAIDLSGQGNHLFAVNTPTFGYDSLIPYVQLSNAGGAANQYLYRADAGAGDWADVQGNEIYIIAADRGMTLYGWFYFDNAVGSNEYMISKFGAAGNRSYLIRRNAATGSIDFIISTDCTNQAVNLVGDIPATTTWFFVAARFDPSTECAIFVNDEKDTTGVGVPATICDGGEPFTLGIQQSSLTADMTGRISHVALCAAQHEDRIILSVFHQTRAMFGV
jgi:hypothetical protein